MSRYWREHIHPSCPLTYQLDLMTGEHVQPDHERQSGRYFGRSLFCAQLSLVVVSGWLVGEVLLLPRVTTPHQLLSQVQCVNLQNSQKSPEKGNNWSRPIIGQTRPNFFENCPITFQPVLASHDFQKKDKNTCLACQQVCLQRPATKKITTTL